MPTENGENSILRGTNLETVAFLCNRDVVAKFKAAQAKYDVTPGTMLAAALDALEDKQWPEEEAQYCGTCPRWVIDRTADHDE